MITSTTQTAVAALIAAIATDFPLQTVQNISLNVNQSPDGAAQVNINVQAPVANTMPAANGNVSINYIIPAKV
jgi:hypothetical protein